MRKLLIATLVVGFVLNLTGWAGNVFLLGSMWEAAGSVAPPPMRRLSRRLFTPSYNLSPILFWPSFCVSFIASPCRRGVAQRFSLPFFVRLLSGLAVCRWPTSVW